MTKFRWILILSFLVLGACSGSGDGAPDGAVNGGDDQDKSLPVSESSLRIENESKARDLFLSNGQSFAVDGNVYRLSQLSTLGKPQSAIKKTHCHFDNPVKANLAIYSGLVLKVIKVSQRQEERSMNAVNIIEIVTDASSFHILCTKKVGPEGLEWSEVQAALAGILSFY
ncbi:MAG: hypothetical protein KDD33_13495 [Bdellovibrionales bacterium]|nr:hypothetical protein [Bdellovibrionales bacterium]